MKKISIEYSHIYTNGHIGDEQKLSLDILKSLKKEIGNSETSLVVMVDDYSFPDPDFNYEELVLWLKEKGFEPDVMIRESQLIPTCDEVLKLIQDKKLKEQVSDYVRAKKYPCSLFVASWYLLRLGYVKSPLFNAEFVGEKLINILPASFRPFEDKGFEIIKSTKYAEAVDKIENKYFEGRLIA